MPARESVIPELWKPWIFRGMALFAVVYICYAGIRYLLLPLTLDSPELPVAAATRVHVSSRTLRTNEKNVVHVWAPDRLDPSLGPVTIEIPGLGVAKNVSVSELYGGTTVETSPKFTGFFELRLRAKGDEVAWTPIAAVPPIQPGADEGPTWAIATGPTRVLESGAIYVPVYATAERDHDVPLPVRERVKLQLKDRLSNSDLGNLVIEKGQAISEPISVLLTPSTKYELMAVRNDLTVGSIPVDWPRNGPKLVLTAKPGSQEVFTAMGLRAKTNVYLTFQRRKVNPSETVLVNANCPAGVIVEPEKMVLTPQDGEFTCMCHYSGLSLQAPIIFSESSFSSSYTTVVSFLFPWIHFFMAIGFAAIGSLVSPAGQRFRPIRKVLVGTIAGLLLYIAFLATWLRITGSDRIEVLSAVLVGFVGGYAGPRVFDFLKGHVFGLPAEPPGSAVAPTERQNAHSAPAGGPEDLSSGPEEKHNNIE
jgi:hypothetical protein